MSDEYLLFTDLQSPPDPGEPHQNFVVIMPGGTFTIYVEKSGYFELELATNSDYLDHLRDDTFLGAYHTFEEVKEKAAEWDE